MRRSIPLFLVVIALTLSALPARAEEGDDAGAVEVPAYSAEDMIFADSDLLEGWTACPDSVEPPAGAPTEGALMQMGEAVGLDEDTLYVESRAIRNGEKLAVVSLIDIDTNPEAFRKALEAQVASAGWVLLDLGCPLRVMVVSASDAETAKAIADWQRETAVRKLADAAWKKLQERSVQGGQAAEMLLKAGAAIEPKAGAVAAIAGFLQRDPNQKIGMWMHAIAPDTPIPVEGEMRVQIAAAVGVALFQTRDEQHVPRALASLKVAAESIAALEGAARPRLAGDLGNQILTETGAGRMPSESTLPIALAALEDAVAHESALDVEPGSEDVIRVRAFGNRYNLSCTYARLGQLDKAFELLDSSLAIAKAKLPTAEYTGHYNHAKKIDPDMSPLREDERFAELMKKHAPAEGSDG